MKKLLLLAGLLFCGGCAKEEPKEITTEDMIIFVNLAVELKASFEELDVIRAFTIYNEPFYHTDLVYMVEGDTDADNKFYEKHYLSYLLDSELIINEIQ